MPWLEHDTLYRSATRGPPCPFGCPTSARSLLDNWTPELSHRATGRSARLALRVPETGAVLFRCPPPTAESGYHTHRKRESFRPVRTRDTPEVAGRSASCRAA